MSRSAVLARALGNWSTGGASRPGVRVRAVRFDDSLATVLAADAGPGPGAEAAWRQLADLTGRRRVPDVDAAVERLRTLRDQVPAPVRAASARALAAGEPPAALVALFAEDEPATAAPVLRDATLSAAEWLSLLPRLTPRTRALLRNRRDLPADVVRGLASFGATDFVLGHDAPVETAPAVPAIPEPDAAPERVVVPITPSPFVAVGDIARALPVVAEALRRTTDAPRFEIADLVARIDAFRRDQPVATPAPALPPERFEFHTDAAGTIRWVEGVARTALIGIDVARAGTQGVATLDSAAAVAFRARAAFRDVRLHVGGESSAAGDWRLAGVPRFDHATGRFIGLAGAARRLREDAPAATGASAADALRQLVHELRTPVNAIAGFAELIGTELLGPVPPVYRDRARLIQGEAAGLTTAIDDLDTAARLESDALDLRTGTVDLAPVLADAVAALQPLAGERRAMLIAEASVAAAVAADDRAVARLIDRFLTAALAAAEPGERLTAQLVRKTRSVRLHLTRPRALTVGGDDALLATEPAGAGQGGPGPLLGVGFTLRLVRDLAAALGGALVIAPDRLTLRLPAAVTAGMERAAQQ